MIPLEIAIGPGERPGTLGAWARRDGEEGCLRGPDHELPDSSPQGLIATVCSLLDAFVAQLEPRLRFITQIRLTPPLAQVRTLRDLPPVRKADLDRLVAEHRDQFFRPSGGQAVLSARREQVGDETVVRAALADGALLDEIESTLEKHGVRVVRFLATAGTEGHSVELRSTRQRARVTRRRRQAVGVAMGLMIASWVTPQGVYWFDLLRDDRVVRCELDRIRGPLTILDSLEARLSEFSPVAEAFRRQAGKGWAARALTELAMRLPRDTHLQSLLIRSGEATLEVHAPAADSVPEALERAWEGRIRILGEPAASDPFTVVVTPAP